MGLVRELGYRGNSVEVKKLICQGRFVVGYPHMDVKFAKTMPGVKKIVILEV